MRPITFAHRGARLEAPENTLAAFRAALGQGVSGLETDAWLSGDGEVVLVHDAVVRRGLRRHRVATTPAATLAALGIPRLADLYEQLGTDYELSVDLEDPAVTEPVLSVARDHAACDRLWCCSPDLAVVARVRSEPSAHAVHSSRRAAVDGSLERHAARLAAVGVAAMNMHHTDWTPGLVSLFHRFGVLAFAWDAQEVRHLRAMLAMGVDGLYCDRPAHLVGTVAEWSTASSDDG